MKRMLKRMLMLDLPIPNPPPPNAITPQHGRRGPLREPLIGNRHHCIL